VSRNGEAQGLAATPGAFHPFWNDTRTGRPEIFTAAVRDRLSYTSRRRISQLAAASSSADHGILPELPAGAVGLSRAIRAWHAVPGMTMFGTRSPAYRDCYW